MESTPDLSTYQAPRKEKIYRPEVPGRRPGYTAPSVSEGKSWANEGSSGDRRDRPRKFPWDIVDIRTDLDDPLAYSVYRPLIFDLRSSITNTVTVTVTGDSFLPVADSWLIAEIEGPLPVTAVAIKRVTDAAWAAETEYPSCYKFDTSTPFAFQRARIPLWRFYDENTADYPGGRFLLGAEGNIVYGVKLVADGPLHVVYTLEEVPGENRVRAVPDLIA